MPVVEYTDEFEAQVLAGCREMHAESVLHRDIPISEERLLVQLKAARTLLHVYFRICVLDGEVLGGFFGMISGVYFSEAHVAKDLAWFVKKTARGSLAAVALHDDFERWARAKGVHHILVGQSTGVRMDTTQMLYERLGYEKTGTNNLKRI